MLGILTHYLLRHPYYGIISDVNIMLNDKIVLLTHQTNFQIPVGQFDRDNPMLDRGRNFSIYKNNYITR